MTQKDLLEWLRRRPFEPFRLFTTLGRSIDVHNPEFVWAGLSRCSVGLFDQDNPNRSVDVSRVHIVMIEALSTVPQVDA